jgi:hypothetical protein
MVATTRHRQPEETVPQLRRAPTGESAKASHRRSASDGQAATLVSGIVKSRTVPSNSSAASVAPSKALNGGRGRQPRVSKAPSGSDEDDSNQGIFPTKKRQAPPPTINEGIGSDSDDAPEEVTRSVAQQLHEQAAAALRIASQPDLVAKRAEKDRLRTATQAAQEAASRRKVAEAAALEELPQDVLNAAAAVTLTLQQSLEVTRTNHIPLLPEISKKPTSRCFIFAKPFCLFFKFASGLSTASTCRTCRCLQFILHHPPSTHALMPQSERLYDVVTAGSFAASKAASHLQQRLHRQEIVRRPLGDIKRRGPNPAFGGAHCVVR